MRFGLVERHRIIQRERDVVCLRLREHADGTALEQGIVYPIHVVAVDDADAIQRDDPQRIAQLARQLLSLDVESRLLLNVDALDHDASPLLRRFLGA